MNATPKLQIHESKTSDGTTWLTISPMFMADKGEPRAQFSGNTSRHLVEQIVQAVNSYDAMREALEEAGQFVDEAMRYNEQDVKYDLTVDEIQEQWDRINYVQHRIRAALATTNGKDGHK